MYDGLAEKGIRLSAEAVTLLNNHAANQNEIESQLIALAKPFISIKDAEDVLSLLESKNEPKVIVNHPSSFGAVAKEYDADLRVVHSRDVTGKSRTKGEVDDFIKYFQSRFMKLRRFFPTTGKYPSTDLETIKKHIGEKVRVVVFVSSKQVTKKGNLLLEIEDLTGSFKVVVSKNGYNEKLEDKSKNVLVDDIVAISGKVLDAFIIAEDIEWPDIPVTHQRKFAENDLAAVYLSDIHFGSRYFLDKFFHLFAEWLNGRGEAKELAGKVKYIVIAGDVVDGIGIYPNQEKELVVKDVFTQYKMFDDFVESIPDWIEVIVAPGNHDAVRRGEPMPAIPDDLIKSDVTRVGNPASVVIEGLKHLVYHGTSIDSMISQLPDASYNHPEKVMVEYLKRRHLSPLYGGDLIIPEQVDYMVIEDEPDILHCGHVHKNGYYQYRGTVIINSGTFQDRTEFQVKQGHVPTPALVPVYELKSGKLRTLDFKN